MRAAAEEMLDDNPPDDTYYRSFADKFGADRFALAAWFQGAICPQVVANDLPNLTIPVLIVNGEDDFHDANEFVSYLENGVAIVVPGGHISCLSTPELRAQFVEFLSAK